MYDAYVAEEVVPFVHSHCQTPGIGITTTGASFGAYHAVNSLLKHPQVFRRCLGLSGVYDLRRFMDGDYDDNFYFNNPVDYVPEPVRPVVPRAAGPGRHPAGDGQRPLRGLAAELPALGRPVVARDPALRRRLGPGWGP